MERRNVVIGAVLIVVVIIAVVITVRQVTRGPKLPAWVANQQVQKIDVKTMEIVKEPLGDWTGKYAPDATGHWKNPKTGEYTMADVMKCSACGQLIPVPVLPAEYRDKPPKKGEINFAERLSMEYKCPLCGKDPFNSAMTGLPGMPAR